MKVTKTGWIGVYSGEKEFTGILGNLSTIMSRTRKESRRNSHSADRFIKVCITIETLTRPKRRKKR